MPAGHFPLFAEGGKNPLTIFGLDLIMSLDLEQLGIITGKDLELKR
jgi:hypothetical protein